MLQAEGLGHEFGEGEGQGFSPLGDQGHPGLGVGELKQDLAAGTAGGDRGLGGADQDQVAPLPPAVGHHMANGVAFGADGQAVGGVLHVAAGVNGPPFIGQGRSDRELGVGAVRVFLGLPGPADEFVFHAGILGRMPRRVKRLSGGLWRGYGLGYTGSGGPAGGTMNREEALRWLAGENRLVEAGQPVAVERFRSEDAEGVARLFYRVYGDGYPVETYYIPEAIRGVHAQGDLHSVVGRVPSGDVVTHVALYRSSPPNPRLLELGLGLTLPEYRNSRSFFLANNVLPDHLPEGVDGFFGEAVCNHTATQKLSRHVHIHFTALEPALMPAEAYLREQSAQGRVGCVMGFRLDRDEAREQWVPGVYREAVRELLAPMGLERTLRDGSVPLPEGAGAWAVERFDSAGVIRGRVLQPGQGLVAQLAAYEQPQEGRTPALVQIFADLGQAWAPALILALRQRGYSLGGVLPGWFGSDGLLMQKHFVDPDFSGLNLLPGPIEALRDRVRADWEEVFGGQR